MQRLIFASTVKYFKSLELYIAVLCAFIFGVINGIGEHRAYLSAKKYIDADSYIACPSEHIWLICGMWLIIVLTSLHIGREFSDGTIRSKLVIGHTKTAVYLTEIISSCTVCLTVFLPLMIPTIIGGKHFFFEISPFAFAKLVSMLLMVFWVFCALSAAVTFAFCDRAFGTAAAFSIMILLAVFNHNLNGYYYNTEPEYLITSDITENENGEAVSYEHYEKNRYYLKGLPKMLVSAEHKVDPFSYSYEFCSSVCKRRSSGFYSGEIYSLNDGKSISCLGSCAALAADLLVIAFCGMLIFVKKDIK